MDFNYFLYENIIIIQLEGDLLGVSNEEKLITLSSNYLKFETFHCIVDLHRVQYMNSTGLSFLVRKLTIFKNKRGKTILVKPSLQISKLLTITKLDRVFTVADSRQSAIKLITKEKS